MAEQVYIPFLRIHIGRFLFLLITFVSIFLVRPFLEGFIGLYFLMSIFITAVMISGMYAVSRKRSTFIIGLILAVPAAGTQWIGNFVMTSPFNIMRELFAMAFMIYLSGIIINYIFHEKKVTGDVINGAVCVYFLIGWIWACIYAVLEEINAGSFSMPAVGIANIQQFAYFSYVTLTTLGYGEITPLSSSARSMAILESITGQLYIAVMIARLVGIQIAQSQGNSA